MSTLSPLVEYLLAYENPDGSHLVNQGFITGINYFPANFIATWDLLPFGGAFASIVYYYQEGPTLVPETLQLDSFARGIELAAGPLTTASMVEAGFWYVIKAENPVHTTVTNRTNLVQRDDFAQAYLRVNSEPDYNFIMKLIRDWCRNERVAVDTDEERRFSRGK